MKRVLLAIAVVVVHAAAQATLILPGVEVAASAVFLGLLAASTAMLVAAVVALVALAGTGGRPRIGRVILAVVVALAVVATLAVLSTATLIPSVLVALIIVSPLGNAGAGPALGLTSVARHPLRALLGAVLTMIALASVGVAALLLGFLVTGWLGAFATGVIGGALAAVLVRGWARLAARPRSVEESGRARAREAQVHRGERARA